MSYSAFDLPRAVQGLGQIDSALNNTSSGMGVRYYLSYIPYLIPAISIAIILSWINKKYAHLRLISIVGGSVIALGLIGTLLYFQFRTVDAAPLNVISIGYFLAVLSGFGLVAAGLGIINFGGVEHQEFANTNQPDFAGILKSKAMLISIGAVAVIGISFATYKHFTVSPEEAKAELKAMNIDFDGGGFFHAAKTGDTKAFNLFLLAGMHPDFRNGEGVTALHIAAQNKHPELITMLLKSKANVESKLDKNGITPIAIAANVGCTECAILLIGAGANVNVQLSDPVETPLMLASKRGFIDFVKLLLDKGADIKTISDTGRNALIYAIEEKHIEVAKLLLDKGIDPNLIDIDGSTALMIAVSNEDIEAVKALLAKHAKADVKNRDGQSALDLAASNDNKDIMALLPGGIEKMKQVATVSMPPSSNDAVTSGTLQVETEIQSQPSTTLAAPASTAITNQNNALIAPSFDCAKASTNSERLVCSDQQLARADVKLTQAYKYQLEVGTPEVKDNLKKRQNLWRKNERDICSDAACVLRAYEKRIEELQD
jgi:ankyrin repeat protein